MIPADKKTFAEIVMGLAELKGRQLSKPALELFWNSMQHWSLEDFQAAANQLIHTFDFMPTPKNFEDLRKAGRPTPGEAWVKAIQNSKSAIVCGQVTHGASCGDLLIDRAVQAIGGYGVIAMCESDKLCFLERRFCEHYDDMQEASDVREAVPQIASTFKPRLNGGGPKRISDLLSDDAA